MTHGKEPLDEIREPRIDDSGSFVLETGESVLYTGSHKVSVSVWNEAAGFRGRKAEWQSVARPERKASVHFTNQRLLVAWPKWKSDRTSGSLLERHVMTPLMEREQGKMLLCAHVRHPWILSLFVGKPEGTWSRRSKLRIAFQEGAQEFGLVVYGIDPDAAERLGRSFSAAIAGRRLEGHPELTDEQRRQLTDLAIADSPPADVGWATHYRIPAGKKVAYVF
ncbi:MAG: hypothetical protein ACTHKT_12705 [Solirubrobacterales bacterium]